MTSTPTLESSEGNRTFACMHLSDELLDRLATLARLEVAPDQREHLRADLQRMLDFVAQLREVDTEGIEPLIHPTEGANALRPDEPAGRLRPDQVLRNAPKSDGSYFRVPKVVDKEGQDL
ncbi:MAG: Asp-tRNA(Asn)/Glu-tRNA(Gln) amidotransferase GatCAB subunit C [Bacteroidetes bacterium]|nr:MAG: Asp-tRNA(Asn)/Glu-tRNA(Gln) amidotransferase GatCAB subunit C [Bacteroidota bacterium]